jgi:hypothetical protein
MEEHALEVPAVIASSNSVSGVMSIPDDDVDSPARLAAGLNGVIDELECTESILRTAYLFPLELRDSGILEDSLEFAGDTLQLVKWE